jgi:hypothetical protein
VMEGREEGRKDGDSEWAIISYWSSSNWFTLNNKSEAGKFCIIDTNAMNTFKCEKIIRR